MQLTAGTQLGSLALPCGWGHSGVEPLLNSAAGEETLPEEPWAVQWCEVMEGCLWKDLMLCP